MRTKSHVTINAYSSPLVRCLCLVAALIMVFQLFYVGSKPEAAGLIPEPWDKLAHFATYSAITALLWIGTAGRMSIAIIVIVVAVGALDELHQASLPGRVADVWDFFTDVCAGTGTAFALLLLYGADRSRRNTETSPS
jgi:VanZ family protein